MRPMLYTFEQICKAVLNARKKGVDLSDMLIKACVTESFSDNETVLIEKYNF